MYRIVDLLGKGASVVACHPLAVGVDLEIAHPFALVPTYCFRNSVCSICFKCLLVQQQQQCTSDVDADATAFDICCMYCQYVWFCSSECEAVAYRARYMPSASTSSLHSRIECDALQHIDSAIEQLLDDDGWHEQDCQREKQYHNMASEVHLLIACIARILELYQQQQQQQQYDDSTHSTTPTAAVLGVVETLITNRTVAPTAHQLHATLLASTALKLLSLVRVCELPALNSVVELYFAIACNGFGLWSDLPHTHLMMTKTMTMVPTLRCATDDGSGQCYAHGLYPSVSYFNHDCNPNVVRQISGPRGQLTFTTTRAIAAAGSELCIAYLDPAWPVSKRRAHLRDEYYFDCSCAKCIQDLASLAMS
jgi:hypothetical protein